ncbi:hypothetical protein [Streptomyces uncialis]|uniref:hypothetical protein n=1 Tax=Streptomyces uncialis TaxID=1048205 RepID=UPI0033D9C798
MSRRVSLPGADELFRTTGGTALQSSSPRRPPNGGARVPGPAAEGDGTAADGSSEPSAAQPSVPSPARSPHTSPQNGRHGEGAAEHGSAADTEAGESRTRGAERGAERSSDGMEQSPGHPGRRTAPEAATGASGVTAAAGRGAVAPASGSAARRRGRAARRPSGRERHDEKITVYVSAEELMDLEHARLVLRGEHGLAVDRGRIVREAVAVVLADLESRGDASILVRRLRGR